MSLLSMLGPRQLLTGALPVLAFFTPIGEGQMRSIQSAPNPRDWVREAIVACGGERILRGLTVVRLHGIWEEPGVAYSPDIDHPRMYYEIFDELRDAASLRLRRHYEGSVPSLDTPLVATTIISDSVAAQAGGSTQPNGSLALFRAGTATDVQLGYEQLRLGPERLLLTLLEATDLEAAGDTIIQGASHHVVSIR